MNIEALRRVLGRQYRGLAARLWIAMHPRRARILRDQGAWLFGGGSGRVYGDNSAALRQYVLAAKKGTTTFWVIDSDSPDLTAARQHGPVLLRDSVTAHIRAMLARVIVISHGVHDVPECGSTATAAAFRVRLGHGLTALKRTRPRAGHTNESANAVFDLVPVASAFEQRHKLEWDIPVDRLAITGLARFDTLVARDRAIPTERSRILYMPTWRDKSQQDDFCRGICSLLGDTALTALLDRHDGTIEVFLHINIPADIRTRITASAGKRVQFVSELDPQSALARAGLLVTDWSSVAWDMLYVGKPVLFYQFDPDNFERQRGSYLAEEASPGPVVRTAGDAVDALARYLDGSWAQSPENLAVMERCRTLYFAYQDDRNCARIVDAIESRI